MQKSIFQLSIWTMHLRPDAEVHSLFPKNLDFIYFYLISLPFNNKLSLSNSMLVLDRQKVENIENSQGKLIPGHSLMALRALLGHSFKTFIRCFFKISYAPRALSGPSNYAREHSWGCQTMLLRILDQ